MPQNARKRIAVLAMVAALALQGCAVFVAETPAQKYYEAKGLYNTAYSAALIWAQSPPGQRHPEVILRIIAVDARAEGVVTDIDIAMCFYGVPTLTDPAPPPSPTCIPLVGTEAESKFQFAGQLLLGAAAEIRRQHPDLE